MNGGSCHIRYQTRPYFMSSNDWAPVMSQGGIFDDNPAGSGFATANRIYVKCVHAWDSRSAFSPVHSHTRNAGTARATSGQETSPSQLTAPPSASPSAAAASSPPL